mmetsp:Transcript_12346/g.37180  ORF Transcript_12346/g.37180 Transcript_12346/m.37180 type:complete len:305 (+) Transcript_12346:159-1073(+)
MGDQSATAPQSVVSTPGAEHKLLFLDGGTGHLLKERGVKTSVAGHSKWGNSFLVPALANEDAPDAVREVHEEYIVAGCTVITANNFPCTPWGLSRIDRGEDFIRLTKAAAVIARAAADAAQAVNPAPQQTPGRHTFGTSLPADQRKVADSAAAAGEAGSPLVAGVLPPLGESYSTEGGQLAAELNQPVYYQIAEALKPTVDVLICETMASSYEACAAASAGCGDAKWGSCGTPCCPPSFPPWSDCCAAQLQCTTGHQCGTTTAAGGGAGGRAGGRVWQWVQVHHLRVAGQAGRRRLVIYGAEAA